MAMSDLVSAQANDMRFEGLGSRDSPLTNAVISTIPGCLPTIPLSGLLLIVTVARDSHRQLTI